MSSKPLHPRVMPVATILFVFVGLATAITAAPPNGGNIKINAKSRAPELVAVRIHHDQCPYCRKLTREPEFSRLGTSIESDVLWVTLDMSSEASQKQSAMLMGAMGLEQFWPSDLSGLGTVTFIRWKDRSIVSTIRAFDTKSIRQAARQAISTMDG